MHETMTLLRQSPTDLHFSKLSPNESAAVIMGVLNWMQNKLHGSHHRRRTSEFGADSAWSVDPSSNRPQTDKLNDGLTTAMLSIGTFGAREGHRLKNCERFDELTKLQEELKSLVRARTAGTADDLGRVHHLQVERPLRCSSSSKNGGIVRQRSFRKLATRAFGGFLPRPSFRETVPELRFYEMIWGLLLKSAHPEKSSFTDPVTRDYRAVQMAPKGKAELEDDGSKWIRTDSEYIVLEI